MSLQRGCFTIVLALTLVSFIPGCRKNVGIQGVTPIQLTAAPNTNCQQNGVIGNIEFDQSGVCWSGPNANTPVTLQLPANCPFANCTFPTGAGSMCSGPPNAGNHGQVWTYTSITIGGNPCVVGTNGLIMK